MEAWRRVQAREVEASDSEVGLELGWGEGSEGVSSVGLW